MTNTALEIYKLKEALRVTASELAFFIDEANKNIKSKITSSDLDEPNYHGFQTVDEAMKLVGEA